MKINEYQFDEVYEMLENDYNYELIRKLAIKTYTENNSITNISDKCKIIFNPHRHYLILYKNDIGNENYFDIEIIEEIDLGEAIKYKKCFVKAFEFYYKSNQLIVK